MAHYVNNRALLAAIHSSKNSYCYFTKPEYADYDAIVPSLDSLTPEVVAEALQRRQRTHPEAQAGDVVIRVMTEAHLPVEQDTAPRRGRKTDRVRVGFPAFEHVRASGEAWEVVGRSHWRGDLQSGCFDGQRGRVNRALAEMWQSMALNYSRRGNWRNYSWVDEMRANALVQLSQVGLQFDESKSANAFAFYTTVITNVFKRTINQEHRQLSIRDDLLIQAGLRPSYGRQLDEEAGARRED